jgi:AcrR family transcriptional regulator
MKGSPRKTSEERRQAIIEAIKSVFAEKGFERTTTRELAKTAGVSEALLYKHFPSKKSMYAAIHENFFKKKEHNEIERIMEMKPSTSTLVLMVHLMLYRFIKEHSEETDTNYMHILMTRSLLEDGDYARLLFEQISETWITKFEKCMKEAAKAGDLREIPVQINLRGWCINHIAAGMMINSFPKVPVIDYKMSQDKLIEQTVWFALLGAGLKDEAIKRYYNPDKIALLMG